MTDKNAMKILILGATGLLGNATFRYMSQFKNIETYGTVRTIKAKNFFETALHKNLIIAENLQEETILDYLFRKIHPNVVINCVAARKDKMANPLEMFYLFSLLPQRLSYFCRSYDARLIHISSDGVFKGSKGQYKEEYFPDAIDPYGVAKILGEVDRQSHAVTIRTSIIGHELNSKSSFLEWFLSQTDICKGYTNAIFSGLPSVSLARIIHDVILPNKTLYGIYHIASSPISKFNLMALILERYGKKITIIPDSSIAVDRSLSPKKFEESTDYFIDAWPILIDEMYNDKFGLKES